MNFRHLMILLLEPPLASHEEVAEYEVDEDVAEDEMLVNMLQIVLKAMLMHRLGIKFVFLFAGRVIN